MCTAVPVAGVAGIAVVGAAILGVTPALSTAPRLLAAPPAAYWVPGTNIGNVPPDSVYGPFADAVIDETAGVHQPATKVPYPASFWPISKGYFTDPTYNASVRQGLSNLHTTTGDATGIIIYGYSQGAVVATEYKRETPAVGNTYVLVANPNRPNGGILQRFNGVTVPIVDISFNGATPTDGDTTYDIARQYDGWADFPTYPLNLLADVNALLGIVYLHGKYLADIDPADLNDPTKTDKQVWNNTTYYTIHTDRLPLLMPFGFLPEPLLDALDAPLRALIELGYDRTNYGAATGAGVIPAVAAGDDGAQGAGLADSALRPAAVSQKSAPADGSANRHPRLDASPDMPEGEPAQATPGHKNATDGNAGSSDEETLLDTQEPESTLTSSTPADHGVAEPDAGPDVHSTVDPVPGPVTKTESLTGADHETSGPADDDTSVPADHDTGNPAEHETSAPDRDKDKSTSAESAA